MSPFWSFGIHITTANPFVEDASAFFIIGFSARSRGLGVGRGTPRLLKTIFQDATVYFLIIFTGHILVILFEIFAPVSIRLADLRFSAHDGLHIGADSTTPCRVSRRPEYDDEDESEGVLSYL